MSRSPFLDYWDGRYSPPKRPTLLERVHRYLSWLLAGEP